MQRTTITKTMNNRIISLAVMALSVCVPTAHSQEKDIEASQSVFKISSSNKIKDRIAAAEQLSLLPVTKENTEILWRLIKDSDTTVKGEALLTLSSICTDGKIANLDAQKIAGELKEQITSQQIENARNPRSNDDDVWLLACRMLALDSLYVWYPIVSVVDYQIWQEEMMKVMFLNLASRRDSLSDKTDGIMLAMFSVIFYNPASLPRMVDAIVDEISDIPEERVMNTLLALWKHGLVGKNRPMNYVLGSSLQPHLDKIEAKMTLIQDKDKRTEMKLILEDIRKINQK